jgi:hypothetical protein
VLASCGGVVVERSGSAGGGNGGTAGVTIATKINPTILAMDDAYLYVSASSAISRVGKQDGSLEVLVDTSTTCIAVDADRVYRPDSKNVIRSADKSGGDLQTIDANKEPSVHAMVVDEVTLYWSNVDRVRAWMKPDGPASIKYDLSQPGSASLALHESSVIVAELAGDIAQVPKAKDPGVLIGHVEHAVDVAVDGDDVYVAGVYGVTKISLTSGSSELVGSALTLKGLAVDDSHVFVTTKLDGVLRFPKQGGTSELVVQDHGAYEIVVDDSWIFWTNYETNELKRVAKPPA